GALTPHIAPTGMIESSAPRSSHFREMRHQQMRAEHLFGRRMEMLTLAVLSQLRAKANWHRIAREWMYGDEPVTELGRQEAEFYAGLRTPPICNHPGRWTSVTRARSSTSPTAPSSRWTKRGASPTGTSAPKRPSA